ncbi:hypothetical protein J3R30DRAFT_696637 [Lentinula aciculospora]|uniref:C2H2-type domain-containing protein n=1 Tax=Lentinula aciculospora TaxID=153920 RepID=A0A9W9A3G2_9AGAR|nr:hypothetical protein J3R30DRAFT_696637 [Lentinula aciculospora]
MTFVLLFEVLFALYCSYFHLYSILMFICPDCSQSFQGRQKRQTKIHLTRKMASNPFVSRQCRHPQTRPEVSLQSVEVDNAIATDFPMHMPWNGGSRDMRDGDTVMQEHKDYQLQDGSMSFHAVRSYFQFFPSRKID